MHPAPSFRVTDRDRLLVHLKRYPFATLAAAPTGRVLMAQAPLLVRELESGLVIDFHLSTNNALSAAIPGGFSACLLSAGPDAYVSPDWYVAADQVPTWNYVSVEAEGEVSPLDEAGTIALLDDLSEAHEAGLAPKPPWTRHKMSPGRFEAMLRGIVGARLTVTRLEGTFKLSQNKSAADQAGVVAALGDHPLARMMRGEEP